MKRKITDKSSESSTDSISLDLNNVKNKKKYKNVKKISESKIIKIDDVFKLNLSDDENIWFFEYLQILENTDEYTEDYFRIKNIIYEKYNNLKNIDFSKLTKIKNSDNNILTRILNSNHCEKVKFLLYRKYNNSTNVNNSDELFKITEWIETVLGLPTEIIKSNNILISDRLHKIWKNLNESIFGLQHVKEKVMEMICAKLLNPDSKGRVLTLIGNPGVGKTSIANSIALALDMPFDHISFGSIKDSTILVGHSSTYIGSTPGLFTKIQLNTKRLDTVVLLDEIDKIPDTQEGKSIYYVLLHMLDKLQNHRFRDMYMPEIDLDFSKMIFICAGNSVDNINPIVRDRMDIIEIKDYDIDEKTQIVMKYMLPKIISDLGFNKSDIILEENELKYLIKNKTINKTGMREIERKLSQLCERLSLLKYVKNINFSYNLENIVFPHKVTISDIDKLI